MDETLARSLMTRIAQGDEVAMDFFYRGLSRVVFAFALRHTDNAADAQEVLVDTMLQVWQKAAEFEGRSAVRTWVLGIARFKALDRLRLRQRHQHEDVDEAVEFLVGETDVAAFEMIAQRQRAEHLEDCLQGLSDVQRASLHLVFHEELTLAQVAQVQDVAEGTVKTRVFHARQKLRRCLEGRVSAEDLS
jgi:RNA polymerase sigma-70 factor (ECF subfamily)